MRLKANKHIEKNGKRFGRIAKSAYLCSPKAVVVEQMTL